MEFLSLPKHIGFIMDGNGRWAKAKGMPRISGHKAGVRQVDVVVDLCLKYRISYVSLYVFSTENWSRPQSEVENLFDLARVYLKKAQAFLKKDVRVVVSGDKTKLPDDLQRAIFDVQTKTANCKSLTLNLCINYGGRDEIVHAVNAAVASGVPVDEKSFKNYFYNPFLPELDLVVRTGGEVRLSNFMLFDAAYAELYFSDVMWPDFDKDEFEKMLFSYQNRVRKFGDIK